MKQRQLRNWFYAGLAATLLLSFIIMQLDNNKLYKLLQNQLEQAGINLQAGQLSLSFMHIGSLRLDDVHIQTQTFNLTAGRLFIDLDLAALLTGSALPQALYLQMAEINVLPSQQDAWLGLLKMENIKLKRINISQSEIHFNEQHLTLEKVNLDIRDIGKNKNPRMELRAHVGDGRIDAHGYLHLKRGEITRGFGRMKLYDIPLSSFKHGTNLDTLNGSMTTHLNQDQSWQTFGHVTLQKEHHDEVELRAKLTGNAQELFHIEDMVLSDKNAGALQISGACDQEKSCQINVVSKQILLSPLLKLFQLQGETSSSLENIKLQANLKAGVFTSFGESTWATLAYTPVTQQKKSPSTIYIDAGKLMFSGLERQKNKAWSLQNLSLFTAGKQQPEVTISHASYANKQLELPATLYASPLWLPLAQMLTTFTDNPPVQGKGSMDGTITLNLSENELTHANVNLDATAAEIVAFDMLKPASVNFHAVGELLWQQDELPSKTALSLQLDTSNFTLDHQKDTWSFQNITIDFDHLAEAGIVLPTAWQTWHGYMQGSATLTIPESEPIIEQAEVQLIAFGKGSHDLNGQIQVVNKVWTVEDLSWQSEKNYAEISSDKQGRFNITAESIDTQALVLLQQLPFQAQGKFNAKALHCPFGTLKDVTASYETSHQGISLKTFKSIFYEGSLSSSQVDIFKHEKDTILRGNIQVGGIHLNNWKWLHKQFDTHLEATVYATLNLEAIFNADQAMTSWQGDGDVSIFNGKWLLNDKNVTADKVKLSLRKRKQFNTTFRIKDGKLRGSGVLNIDEQNQISGQLKWPDKIYQFSKTWPHLRYEEVFK